MLTNLLSCDILGLGEPERGFFVDKSQRQARPSEYDTWAKSPALDEQVDASPAFWFTAVGSLFRECGVFCIMDDKKQSLLRKTGGHCAYCGIDLTQETTWHRDHIEPRVSGGRWKGNLIPACPTCNLRKSSRSIDEFRIWIREHAIKQLKPALLDEVGRVSPFISTNDHETLLDAINTILDILASMDIRFFIDDLEK